MGEAGRHRWLSALGHHAAWGLREPIIVILLLSGVFTVISGSLVHGALLLAVAAALALDAARNRHRTAAVPRSDAAGPAGAAPPAAHRWVLPILAVLGGIGLYAVVAGSFIRYSWPATVVVAAVAALAVAIGWRGPLRPGRDPGPLPARGRALWGALLVAAGGWELAAYFMQPSLSTISYAHPTISALTDPLLRSYPGRSAALAIWLLIGWFLAER